MKNNQPTSAGKLRKRTEDRQRFGAESVKALAEITAEDLVGMFGMLGEELIRRRRESELDILRCESFHPDDSDNLARHEKQNAAYTRRLLACSAVTRLINMFDGADLPGVLLAWAGEKVKATELDCEQTDPLPSEGASG